MSEAPYEPQEKAAEKKSEKSERERPMESINYGMHTLPKKFWTIDEGKNLLNSKAFRDRLAAKHLRHEQNKAQRAEDNRRGPRR